MVEHHVDIRQTDGINLLDTTAIHQMFGRNQNLGFFKEQGCLVIGDQDPVIGRNHEVALWQSIPKSAAPDQYRAQMRGGRKQLAAQRFGADPANFLQAVIARDHPVPDFQGFDRALACGGEDHGAGCETGHDLFDIFEFQRAAVVEMDDAIFHVVTGVNDMVNIRHNKRVKVVTTGTAIDVIAAGPVNDIAIGTGRDHVGTLAGEDGIITDPTFDTVVAIATFQVIVALVAQDVIVPRAAQDGIVTLATAEVVMARHPENGIRTGAAVDCISVGADSVGQIAGIGSVSIPVA